MTSTERRRRLGVVESGMQRVFQSTEFPHRRKNGSLRMQVVRLDRADHMRRSQETCRVLNEGKRGHWAELAGTGHPRLDRRGRLVELQD